MVKSPSRRYFSTCGTLGTLEALLPSHTLHGTLDTLAGLLRPYKHHMSGCNTFISHLNHHENLVMLSLYTLNSTHSEEFPGRVVEARHSSFRERRQCQVTSTKCRVHRVVLPAWGQSGEHCRFSDFRPARHCYAGGGQTFLRRRAMRVARSLTLLTLQSLASIASSTLK
ncbi:hypothetical protein E2C01_069880 [Portunus trituberculatus]|uniref:Uncharacterized protein n=1 Tax=Portunus trituberculatus TaxID=210409 RepID=A0A5B7HSQ7_PORTR|nr:hypothetical protein [Portunus trituberculatus]